MKQSLFILTCCFVFSGSLSQPSGLKIYDPERAGFSKSVIREADKVLQRYIDQQKLAGVVALVAKKGEVFYFESFGMQDIENKRKMQLNSTFQIASMTKPITSVALLILMDEGKVRLEDPITKYIMEFEQLRVKLADGTLTVPRTPLTIKNFLMHTTGLPNGGHPSFRENVDMSKINSLKEYVEAFAKLPLQHQPEEGFTYAVNTNVIARVVEVVCGKPFESFIKERIFDPLKMRSTYFFIPEDELTRFSCIYEPTSSGLKLAQGPTATPVKFPLGNGGLSSTAYDYFRFAQMLLNGGELDDIRILKSETVKLMTTDQLPPSLYPLTVLGTKFENTGFGLGVGVLKGDPRSWVEKPLSFANHGNLPAGSFYWSGVTNTYWWADHAHEMVGVVLSQSTKPAEAPVFQEFHQVLYNSLYNRTRIDGGAFIYGEPAVISDDERKFLVDHLIETRHGLLDAVQGLTHEQANFKFDPGRWSILECMEHIAVTETSLWEWAFAGLKEPASPDRRSEVKVNEKMIIARLSDRVNKLDAPGEARPAGRYKKIKTALKDYKERRGETLTFAQTTQDDLRNHFVKHHVAGTIDVYMALVLLSAHQNRHLMQIKEIMADKNFPEK